MDKRKAIQEVDRIMAIPQSGDNEVAFRSKIQFHMASLALIVNVRSIDSPFYIQLEKLDPFTGHVKGLGILQAFKDALEQGYYDEQ